MYRINNDEALSKAIQNLEAQRELELEILKKYAEYTMQELNPLYIAKEKIKEELSSLKDTLKSPDFSNGLMKTGLGLATGFFTTKLLVGSNAGIVKGLLGTAVQTAITALLNKKLPT